MNLPAFLRKSDELTEQLSKKQVIAVMSTYHKRYPRRSAFIHELIEFGYVKCTILNFSYVRERLFRTGVHLPHVI